MIDSRVGSSIEGRKEGMILNKKKENHSQIKETHIHTVNR